MRTGQHFDVPRSEYLEVSRTSAGALLLAAARVPMFNSTRRIRALPLLN